MEDFQKNKKINLTFFFKNKLRFSPELTSTYLKT